MEIWDAYDDHFSRIKGKTLVRGEPIPGGLFHMVCDVIVRHTDGSYLLMQRDARKSYGGLWELTAGGSALKGESPAACAFRELKEETGIVAGRLTELGRVLHQRHRTIYAVYLCVTNWDKEKITLQQGETQAYRWVSAEEIRTMPRKELASVRFQNFITELQR